MRTPSRDSPIRFLLRGGAPFLALGAVFLFTAAPSQGEYEGPIPPMDSSSCENPRLSEQMVTSRTRQLLEALPENSWPPRLPLQIKCFPASRTSFSPFGGDAIQLPEKMVWVFVTQGFHSNPGTRGPLEEPPDPAVTPRPMPQKSWALGYHIVFDGDGSLFASGVMGPPASLRSPE